MRLSKQINFFFFFNAAYCRESYADYGVEALTCGDVATWRENGGNFRELTGESVACRRKVAPRRRGSQVARGRGPDPPPAPLAPPPGPRPRPQRPSPRGPQSAVQSLRTGVRVAKQRSAGPGWIHSRSLKAGIALAPNHSPLDFNRR